MLIIKVVFTLYWIVILVDFLWTIPDTHLLTAVILSITWKTILKTDTGWFVCCCFFCFFWLLLFSNFLLNILKNVVWKICLSFQSLDAAIGFSDKVDPVVHHPNTIFANLSLNYLLNSLQYTQRWKVPYFA